MASANQCNAAIKAGANIHYYAEKIEMKAKAMAIMAAA